MEIVGNDVSLRINYWNRTWLSGYVSGLATLHCALLRLVFDSLVVKALEPYSLSDLCVAMPTVLSVWLPAPYGTLESVVVTPHHNLSNFPDVFTKGKLLFLLLLARLINRQDVVFD